MGFDKCDPHIPARQVTQEKMYDAYVDYLHFNEVIGIANVGQLNRAIEKTRPTLSTLPRPCTTKKSLR